MVGRSALHFVLSTSFGWALSFGGTFFTSLPLRQLFQQQVIFRSLVLHRAGPRLGDGHFFFMLEALCRALCCCLFSDVYLVLYRARCDSVDARPCTGLGWMCNLTKTG